MLWIYVPTWQRRELSEWGPCLSLNRGHGQYALFPLACLLHHTAATHLQYTQMRISSQCTVITAKLSKITRGGFPPISGKWIMTCTSRLDLDIASKSHSNRPCTLNDFFLTSLHRRLFKNTSVIIKICWTSFHNTLLTSSLPYSSYILGKMATPYVYTPNHVRGNSVIDYFI